MPYSGIHNIDKVSVVGPVSPSSRTLEHSCSERLYRVDLGHSGPRGPFSFPERPGAAGRDQRRWSELQLPFEPETSSGHAGRPGNGRPAVASGFTYAPGGR